jgi:hypothetical protein
MQPLRATTAAALKAVLETKANARRQGEANVCAPTIGNPSTRGVRGQRVAKALVGSRALDLVYQGVE